MSRAYYNSKVSNFLKEDNDSILGKLSSSYDLRQLEDLQLNSWKETITILKNNLSELEDSHIALEYSIPRMGKRADAILITKGLVFVIEFKVGADKIEKYFEEQVLDYALDLKNFHEQSHNLTLIPLVTATKSEDIKPSLNKYEDNILHPIGTNKNNLGKTIHLVTDKLSNKDSIEPEKWLESKYKPTPTIIEAAQALYSGHSVDEISRNEAEEINLTETSTAIRNIIHNSKTNKRKSICFVTGVPGAGKTLAGLNIANSHYNPNNDEHAVFLSGNGPLVDVLRQALANNEVSTAIKKTTKKDSLRRASAFIQNIHHFRDELIKTPEPPIEKVIIFDEAQRAWDLNQTAYFMSRKKGFPNFDMSEPNFIISTMDRHEDWCVIICLIGGGQEINTGEAGLLEWFHSIKENYKHWDVFISPHLSDKEYTNNEDLYSIINKKQIKALDELHLSTSIRSFRSNKLSSLVKSLLDSDVNNARLTYNSIKKDYPFVVTRDINKAKLWLKNNSRGSERFGIIASSGASRLKPYGINIKQKIDPPVWFLNNSDDVRSSNFLEDIATEFDIQGLELDWACVAWDANLIKKMNSWDYKNFVGTKWQNINKENAKKYLLNTYRVLLTRARQGIIVFIPEGDPNDSTRLPEFYDSTFEYLVSCGIDAI